MKLHCPRCDKDVDLIIWRYTRLVDNFARWDEETQRYDYNSSVDKGDLDCITLCYYCGAVSNKFGYAAANMVSSCTCSSTDLAAARGGRSELQTHGRLALIPLVQALGRSAGCGPPAASAGRGP